MPDPRLGPLRIRCASEHDLPALSVLLRQLSGDDPEIGEDKLRAVFRQITAIEGSGVFVADSAGQLVSTATLLIVPNLTRGGRPFGLLENVVTDRACQGQGLGSGVLQTAIDAAWRAGCYKIMLMTGSDLPGTHRFYRSLGFEASKTGYQLRRWPKRQAL